MDFSAFQACTFDCYGTLIDWETGILNSLRPVLAAHGVTLSDAQIITQYAAFEAALEKGDYLPYKEVLRNVARRFGKEHGFTPSEAETNALVDGFANWKPFPDTVAALKALKSRYRLAILSNVDDDLFARTAPQLEVTFDDVITAQQIGSYKPAVQNFETAIRRLALPREAILHVAQSLYHDIQPAKALGLSTVWVNRPSVKPGSGVALPALARPDLEVPDLQTLAGLITE